MKPGGHSNSTPMQNDIDDTDAQRAMTVAAASLQRWVLFICVIYALALVSCVQEKFFFPSLPSSRNLIRLAQDMLCMHLTSECRSCASEGLTVPVPEICRSSLVLQNTFDVLNCTRAPEASSSRSRTTKASSSGYGNEHARIHAV